MKRGRRGHALRIAALAVLLGLCAVLSSCGGNQGKTGVALIIKTQSNPYFVSMKQAALAQARRPVPTSRSRPARSTATRSRRSTRSTPPSRAATRAS